jgi:hypothetical protein
MPKETMGRIGTVAQAVLRASRPGLANGRLAKAIVPTTRECDLPALFVREIDRELPRLVMFWEGGGASDEEYRAPTGERRSCGDLSPLPSDRRWTIVCGRSAALWRRHKRRTAMRCWRPSQGCSARFQ